MNTEKRLKEINKKILTVSIIEMPGTVMLGLGLYAKFTANGNAFMPLLNDESIVNFLLVGGALIMAWGSYKVFTLSREKVRLSNEGI